nr:1907_t:CDS:2 [Entrophospora candida]
MGKAEGRGKEWHGHVTAITVAPEYIQIGLADRMTQLLENVSENIEEDAYDMRKPLRRDVNRESVVENGELNYVRPEDL